MKFWIGVLIVSPLWGLLSTQLLIQVWLATVGMVCGILGIFRGRVPFTTNLMGIGVGVVSLILWSVLMRGGFYLIIDVLEFGYSSAENTIYWICAAIFLLGSIPQIVASVRNSWRFAMVPGALDEATQQRKLDAALRKVAA